MDWLAANVRAQASSRSMLNSSAQIGGSGDVGWRISQDRRD
jgi:hypothetical protein